MEFVPANRFQEIANTTYTEARSWPWARTLSVGGLRLASGIKSEALVGNSLSKEGIEAAVAALATRKPEDLIEHHRKVGELSTAKRKEYWQKEAEKDPVLLDPNKQIEKWRDDTINKVLEMREQFPRHYLAALEILGIDSYQDAELPDEELRQKLSGKTEEFRMRFFSGSEPDIAGFAKFYTEGKSLQKSLISLSYAEPFLGVFGKNEAVTAVKDAVIADAFLALAQQKKGDASISAVAREILAQDMPEPDSQAYSLLYPEALGASRRGDGLAPTTPLTVPKENLAPGSPTTEEPAPVVLSASETDNKNGNI